MELVFETHSLSEDNDLGLATGWLPGRLSERGRAFARQLGERRRDDGLAVVLCSDLRRATETVELAFEGTDVPVLLDWRLRECDYGAMNGRPVAEVHSAVTGIDERFPGGESWREAVLRAEGALADIEARWPDERVLVAGTWPCGGPSVTATGACRWPRSASASSGRRGGPSRSREKRVDVRPFAS